MCSMKLKQIPTVYGKIYTLLCLWIWFALFGLAYFLPNLFVLLKKLLKSLQLLCTPGALCTNLYPKHCYYTLFFFTLFKV